MDESGLEPDVDHETGPESEPVLNAKPAAPIAELFAQPQPANNDQIQDIINRQVAWVLAQSTIAATDTVVVLHDPNSINRSHANRIYEAVSGADRGRPLLLVVTSRGGDIASAYFIAKVCRESTDAYLKVAVPREAKSAATLISCGADEIHMGSLSELGPIDPQFGDVPALAVKHSVEHIAQLGAEYPAAREMFADYLSRTLRIDALGYFERVAASAVQYAERLLNARLVPDDPPGRRAQIANQLVYAYKDHGFVIDSREATDLFGSGVVKFNSPEYKLANQLYGALDFMEWFARRHLGKDVSFVGGASGGCWAFDRPES